MATPVNTPLQREVDATTVVSEPVTAPRPLTGGAVMAAASQIWVTLAGGATTIVLARVLGPHDWGGYSIAVSLVAILSVLATLGVNQGIAYFVGAGAWSPRMAFASSLRVAVLAGAFGAGAGLAARALLPSAFAGLPLWLTAVAVAGLPFALVLGYITAVAVADDRYEAAMSIPALQAGVALGAAIPAAVLFGRTGAVSAFTTSTVVAGIGALVWAGRRLPRGTTREPAQIRRAIRFGIKGYSANALQLVNYQLDLFILAAVAPAAAVGRYALAVNATMLLLLLPRALSAVLYPRVARLSAGGNVRDRDMVETKSLRHISLILAVTTLALAAALEFLVVPVFGATYRPTTDLGLILLPGAAALGIATVLAASIVGRGRPIYSLWGGLITTPPTVAMYATMIPSLHATGAALASTVSYLLGFGIMCWFYRRVTGQSVARLLVPSMSEIDDLRRLARTILERAHPRQH